MMKLIITLMGCGLPAGKGRDSSEKPGEDFVQGFVPDLQRIARAKIDIKTILMIAPIAFSFLMFKLIYIFLKR